MPVELMTSVVALAGIVITTFGAVTVARMKKRQAVIEKENRQYKTEIRYRSDVLSLKMEAADWNRLQNAVQRLLERTPIDRFLILNAYNGENDPKWTTTIHKIVSGQFRVVDYFNFEIDGHYVDVLHKVRSGEEVLLDAAHLGDSILKRVYQSEGVKQSLWFMIREKRMSDSKTVSISYCSFSTHGDEKIDADTILDCRRIVGMLRKFVFDAEVQDL